MMLVLATAGVRVTSYLHAKESQLYGEILTVWLGQDDLWSVDSKTNGCETGDWRWL